MKTVYRFAYRIFGIQQGRYEYAYVFHDTNSVPERPTYLTVKCSSTSVSEEMKGQEYETTVHPSLSK